MRLIFRKLLLFVFLMRTSCLWLSAQGIINNGASVYINSNTTIWIDGNGPGGFTNQDAGAFTGNVTNNGSMYVHGNWTNNATSNVFTSNAGFVYLNGPAQLINGSTPTFFYRLSTAGTGAKTLGVNTSVGGGFPAPNGGITIVQPIILNSNVLTITNPAAGLATVDDTGGGYIISETNAATNPSIIQWNMGSANGNYKFPFGDASGILIPFYLNKSAGTGNVSVSTRHTNTAIRDNQPWQSGVSTMFSPVVGGPGEIPVVVDRWWDVNVSGTTTAALTFTYQGTENTLAGAYQSGPLGAQTWYGSGWAPPTGTGPGVTVGTAQVVTPSQPITTRPWVISSIAAPLPVEMLNFDVVCSNKKALLQWSTASETDNDFFDIQRSSDALNFESLKKISGAGTTNIVHHYSFIDEKPLNHMSYYRIKQVDFNGSSTATSPEAFDGCANEIYFETYIANSLPGEPVLVINSSLAKNLSITVFDAAAKLILNKYVSVSAGMTYLNFSETKIANGIYLVRVSDSLTHQNHKMVFSK